MKRIIMLHLLLMAVTDVSAQNRASLKSKKMKLNAGIITNKLAESKAFYQDVLNFGTTFENEFYLLMHTPNHSAEISFLLPNHSSQQALFHQAFPGEGIYLTIEVEEVDDIYKQIKEKGVEIKIPLRNEPWGDRHFAISDPNGVNIDIVKYQPRN